MGSASRDAASRGTTVSSANAGSTQVTSGAEQAHRDAPRVELGGPAAVEPELEAGALEAGEQRHAVAEVVAQHVGQRVRRDRRAGASASSSASARGRPRRRGGVGGERAPARPAAATWRCDQRVGDGERQAGGGGEPQEVDEVGQGSPHRSLVGAATRGDAPRVPHQPAGEQQDGGATTPTTSADAPAPPGDARGTAGSRPRGARRGQASSARRARRSRRASAVIRRSGDARHPDRADGVEADAEHEAGEADRRGEQEPDRARARPWRRGRAKPSGAVARTAAEARAWVASARTSARSSWRSRSVAATPSTARATSPPAPAPIVRAAATSRTSRGRVVRRRPHGRARRRPAAPCSIRPATARSSAPSGSATSRGQRDQRRSDGVAGPEGRGEPIEGVGQLPVASRRRRTVGQRRDRARRRTRARSSADRAPRRRSRRAAAPGRVARTPRTSGGDRQADQPRASRAPRAGRAAACPERAGRGAGRSCRPVGPGEEPDARSVGAGGSTTSATATIDRAPSVGASDLHDRSSDGAELVAHGGHREVEPGGEHHHLEAPEGVERASWRGTWTASPRGPCSSPTTCRPPPVLGPRRR